MKIYLCLILNIYLAFSLTLEKSKLNQEILKEDDIELIYEGNLKINSYLEFDENYIITKITWTKEQDYKYNYLLGVFEGSNEESFMEGIPIGIIKEKEELEETNELEITSKNSVKYIRYIPPNKNYTDISPIKIYGYKKAKDEDENNYFQATNLPLVLIHTEKGIEPNQNGDVNCTIKLINEGKMEISDTGKIKVRGKSTSSVSQKKPYRIKFSSKQRVLNSKGKEKKWTLIANYFDRSLLRNKLAFKISEIMEFPFTPRCLPVDVILNGDFRGSYYICDKIEVGNNRINISKMEPTDIDEPNISGGYLLQIDSGGWGRREQTPVPGTFKAEKGLTGKILYPEEDEITPEQESYIRAKINKMEDEVYNGILDSIDLDSYCKYFIIEEFCGDPDHVWSSYYFSKDRNDDKFHFGPAWDFDLGFDNDGRLYPTSNKTEFCFHYCDSAGTMRQFVQALIDNKEVAKNVQKTWERMRETGLDEKVLLDFIEEEKNNLEESSELNILKWDNYVENWGNGRGRGGGFRLGLGKNGEEFETSVEVLKEYVKNRFNSLSKLIDNAVSSAQ